ncbi:DOMON-like domain-containing protein [Desulforhopalus sp. 52FAK]
MIKRALRPFAGNEADAVEGIEYGVWRDGTKLRVEYDIYGLLSHLVIPPYVEDSKGKRCDDLWRHTCLELFVKDADTQVEGYLECNFSPSGDWNIYSFDSYRTGMTQAYVKSEPVIVTEKTAKIFSLCAEVDLDSFIPAAGAIDVGVSCIVEGLGGTFGYWALSHPGEKPDFHDPRCFLKSF